MDAATVAAMSDPERNPAFRRRWHDTPCRETAPPRPPALESGDAIELTGRELREQWRRERARLDAEST
jgi:hypothetical protein